MLLTRLATIKRLRSDRLRGEFFLSLVRIAIIRVGFIIDDDAVFADLVLVV